VTKIAKPRGCRSASCCAATGCHFLYSYVAGKSGKTCPSATPFTANATRTNLGSNPGLRGGMPATNRLSHGSDKCCCYYQCSLVQVYQQQRVTSAAIRERSSKPVDTSHLTLPQICCQIISVLKGCPRATLISV
jgi:hypothetical protein